MCGRCAVKKLAHLPQSANVWRTSSLPLARTRSQPSPQGLSWADGPEVRLAAANISIYRQSALRIPAGYKYFPGVESIVMVLSYLYQKRVSQIHIAIHR